MKIFTLCALVLWGTAVLAGDTNTGAVLEQPAPAAATQPVNPNELRLNFRGAPIETVLNYLSDAAGFIIQLNTPVHGKMDVWSNQPVTKDEAVELLNSVLNHNGYAAVRNERVLTIMSREDALHSDIPVKVSDDPNTIPKNDEIVTLIIPIRFVEAEQLVKDLSPLVSPRATIIANEAGNSIVVTDTQVNIRHLAEIVKAIDTSAEDIAEIRVFHLKHHDPVEIATLLNGLFGDSTSTTGTQAPFRFGGPGFGGGFGGFGGFGGGGFGGGGGRAAAATAAGAGAGTTANQQNDRIKKRARVVAVADARTGSVVVTASKDMIGQIASMVEQLDQDSPKVAHVSVFHLENADPQQVEQVLQDMFQSSTSTHTTSTQTSPLQSRIQQNSGTATSSSGLGNSSLGNSRPGAGASF
jgi:general secretion pathway protein D